MKITREIDCNGAIHDIIELTTEENDAIDQCHEILRARFEERGEPYGRRQKEVCEWWLQGIIRYEGMEKMISFAKNAPFHEKGSSW